MKYLKLVRLNNIKKNIVIFLPLVFSGELLEINFSTIYELVIASIYFYLVSINVYIMNDYFDKFEDAEHPIKKFRVIASGDITNVEIFITLTTNLILTFSIFSVFNYLNKINLIIFLYLLNNIVYNLLFKKINITLASTSIAFGFVLRVFIGGIIGNVEINFWLPLFVFLSTFIVSTLKKINDTKDISKYYYFKKRSNKILSLILILYIVHLLMVISLENFNEVIFLTFLNIFLSFKVINLIFKKFLESLSPIDPLDLFKFNSVTLTFVLWAITYLQIRYLILT